MTFFCGVLKRSPVTYASQNTADYLSALVNDVKLIEEKLPHSAFTLLSDGSDVFSFAGDTTMAKSISYRYFAGLSGTSVCCTCTFRQKASKSSGCLFTAIIRVYWSSQGLFNGYEVIRGYSAYKFIRSRFLHISKETVDKKIFSRQTDGCKRMLLRYFFITYNHCDCICISVAAHAGKGNHGNTAGADSAKRNLCHPNCTVFYRIFLKYRG